MIEDHALVRDGLMMAVRGLEEQEDATEVVGACDADEASALLADDDDFDLALLDLMMPGTSGLAFLGVIRKRHPHIPVVVLSALDDAETVRKVIKQGAAGFVSKASPTGVLMEALQAVMTGETWLPPEYRDLPPPPRRRPRTAAERYGLTKTQACVLDLIAEGKPNREIATLMSVTEGTVKIHVSAIFKALNVSNRSQALLLAKANNK